MLANALDKLHELLKFNPKPQNIFTDIVNKMRKKVHPKMKLKTEKTGFCEMCKEEYTNLAKHEKSPNHIAILKEQNNFLSLDSLIASGADVSTYLDNSIPLNGERRSLRKVCNGEIESRKRKCSLTPDNLKEDTSPKYNGAFENKRTGRKRTKKFEDDDQFYKVVGVNTKLRSSGGFMKKKDSPPTCNGAKPLVVKFKKVRKSELSVLSDEAEQFMFPKRASSTSSTSSDEPVCKPKIYPTTQSKIYSPPLERRRLARPVALKEESSEEEWPGDKRKRRRKVPIALKKTRKTIDRTSNKVELDSETITEEKEDQNASPLREEPVERCLKWQDGRLKYTPAVEQLEFAFEAVPCSEPWFETFKRQDQDKVLVKNVPQYFELYTKSPKLPYEIGQLPPLKSNCCGISNLPKREDKAEPSRLYGTRGMKRTRRTKKRVDALLALENHPRKSPREHASTLAMLGSAVLNRRKNTEDTKSTASEDTYSDTHSHTKIDPPILETQQLSERLQKFYSEVLEDDTDFELPELESPEAPITVTSNVPDVINLVSECENCDLIQREVKESVIDNIKFKGRGRFKKKNKTGWPKKKKFIKKESRENSCEGEKGNSLDTSSVDAGDEASMDTLNECSNMSEKLACDENQSPAKTNVEVGNLVEATNGDIGDVHLDVKVVLQDSCKKRVGRLSVDSEKRKSRSSASENEEKDEKFKRKHFQNLGDWMQPVVRVARVDTRMLRSSSKGRSNRLR